MEERIEPELLRLRAEMRLPGLAWLEWQIESTDGGSTIKQRATFYPRGLAGQAYWWSVAPFHAFVFKPMLRNLVRKAESLATAQAANAASNAREASKSLTGQGSGS